jgi:hypothetical protein
VVIRSGACCRVRRLAKNCGASGGLPRPSYDRALWALRTWLDSWSGIGRIAVGMAHQGFDLQLTRYARLAGDVLHDRDGTLGDQRHRHRLGAHAVARDAAGGVGGVLGLRLIAGAARIVIIGRGGG